VCVCVLSGRAGCTYVWPASQTHSQTDRQTDGGKKREVQSTYEYNPRHKQQRDTANMNRNIRLAHTSSAKKKAYLHLPHALAAPSYRASNRESTYRFAVVRAVLHSETSQSAHDQPARNAVLGPNVQRRGSSSDRKAPFSSTLALARFARIS
jgi:hypothetical protein